MNESLIAVSELSKTYRVPVRAAGLAASLKSMARRTYNEVPAVQGISFNVAAGEVVGFIGPNGAGKTTTLKMLAGLLHPSGGEAHVAGFVPWQRRADYLRQISMVMGNKSQMLWDIPPLDTFRVIGEIYRVPPAELKRNTDELVALLDMEALLNKPVRNLSLGERMKCELVAALLYRPAVLFLDEPTLGLDITMQRRLRRFIAGYNAEHGVTIILTSHYMADVQALCPRVILIHEGRLLYDGKLAGLAEQLAPFKLIRLTVGNGRAAAGEDLAADLGADLVESAHGRMTLRVGREQAPAVTAHLLNTLPLVDLAVEDPPIEAVIDQIYQGGEV